MKRVAMNNPMQQKNTSYSEENNQESALRVTKSFLENLVHLSFFEGPAMEGLSPRRKAKLSENFTKFAAKNKIMCSPVGQLSLPMIEEFLISTFEVMCRTNHKLSNYDILAMIGRYKGQNNAK